MKNILVALCGLIGVGQALNTSPVNTLTVHQGNDYNLEYEWNYVPGTPTEDAYILLEAKYSGMDVGGNKMFALAFGVTSSAVNGDTPGRNGFLYQQALRSLLITLDYTNDVPEVVDMKMIYEFCFETATCNGLGGWGRPRTRTQNQVDKTDCTTDRVSIESMTSTHSGGRQDFTIVFKFYENSFQQCPSQSAADEFFKIDFSPFGATGFTYAMWTASSLAAAGGDPIDTSQHNFNWVRSDALTVTFTEQAPTPRPTMYPTSRPTPPTRSPTGFPTPRPTTPIPTSTPTTGRPTPTPTERPTRSPTGRPTPAPTDPPTDRPTEAPTKPLGCPNHDDWVICNNVNTMWQWQDDVEVRKNKIKAKCNSREFKNRCVYCENGRDSFTGCRPRKDPSGYIQDADSVCGSSSDPFFGLSCEQFPECPKPEHMSGCAAVNFIDVNQRWRLRSVCEGQHEHKGYTIPAGACKWCNGWCRSVAPYEHLSKYICRIPGLFDLIKQCPDLDSAP